MRSEALKVSSQMRRLLFSIGAIGLICCMGACSATGVPGWRGSGFLRERFLQYRRIAILPFEGDSSGDVARAFTIAFQKRFPPMRIVEQKKILAMFRREKLVPSRVNDRTRSKLAEMLNAEALVTGEVYYPSIVSWILQVKIEDTATAETLGHAYVEINYMGAEGIDEACQLIVRELKLQADR